MSTITYPDIIVNILKNNGYFTEEGMRDPQVYGVYQYQHDTGQTHWKIIHDNGTHHQQIEEMVSSPFVRGPVIRLWDKVQGLSVFGIKFLRESGVDVVVEGQGRTDVL